jgi:TRAP-type C4-dicarboxylate transport system substrate-binding protein
LTGQRGAGVRILYLLATPPLKFHMSKARINSLADFKDLKIRYAGEAFANTIKAFGAVPVAVPPGETADAMSKGVVAGALFPFEGAQSFQLGTETKFSYEPGINAATFFLVMNPKSYEKLPSNLRALIDETTGPAAAERVGQVLEGVEKEGRAYMLSKGTQVVEFSDAVTWEMRAAVRPLIKDGIAKLNERGMPGQAFYSEFQKAR